MRALDTLRDEHRVIEQVLNCLEKLADRCEAEEGFDVISAREALDFFRHFADRCHHGKEEACLFPLLETHGFVRERGPTGVMLNEHELGRKLVAGMAAAIEQNAAPRFVRHARAFVHLLREHIHKEDHCLFPMAAEVLSDAEAEKLAQSFDNVESTDMGEGTHEQYLHLAAELADRLGVSHASVTPSCGHGRCHHASHSRAI